METLLGGPIYHFQSKLTAKEPFVGGAWEWHQDYGYWYHNGCLFPHLASCQIALDRSNSANGCLQMVRGSHLLGRIESMLIESLNGYVELPGTEYIRTPELGGDAGPLGAIALAMTAGK